MSVVFASVRVMAFHKTACEVLPPVAATANLGEGKAKGYRRRTGLSLRGQTPTRDATRNSRRWRKA